MIELILPPKPKMTVNGISAYRLYLSLKLHYAGKIDIIKQDWNPVRVSDAAYSKCKAKYYFEKMSKKFTLGELSAIMITNFAANPDAWGGEIADADSLTFYRQAIGRIDRMESVFLEEVEAMLHFGKKKGIKFKDLLTSANGQPWVFKFVQQQVISYETMIVLDALFRFVDTYDAMNDHVWANGYASRIKAYRRLCTINKDSAYECFKKCVENFKKFN